MKIPNSRELQQITFNHLSDVGYEDFMNLYKKCTKKPYPFSVAVTSLALDNPLLFRKSVLERI